MKTSWGSFSTTDFHPSLSLPLLSFCRWVRPFRDKVLGGVSSILLDFSLLISHLLPRDSRVFVLLPFCYSFHTDVPEGIVFFVLYSPRLLVSPRFQILINFHSFLSLFWEGEFFVLRIDHFDTLFVAIENKLLATYEVCHLYLFYLLFPFIRAYYPPCAPPLSSVLFLKSVTSSLSFL